MEPYWRYLEIFVIAVPIVGPLRARCTAAADTCRVLVVNDSALNGCLGAQSRRPNLFQASDTAEEDLSVPRIAMEIAEADDGNSAVALVRMAMVESRPFDVVFMASVMIHIQGPEAAQAMRAMGYGGMIVGGRDSLFPSRCGPSPFQAR